MNPSCNVSDGQGRHALGIGTPLPAPFLLSFQRKRKRIIISIAMISIIPSITSSISITIINIITTTTNYYYSYSLSLLLSLLVSLLLSLLLAAPGRRERCPTFLGREGLAPGAGAAASAPRHSGQKIARQKSMDVHACDFRCVAFCPETHPTRSPPVVAQPTFAMLHRR